MPRLNNDILIFGSDRFLKDFETRLKNYFAVSKVEHKDFKYTGLDLTSNQLSFQVTQDQKCEELKQFDIERFCDMENLNEEGTKIFQQQVGQLGWISQQTRPDLAFETLSLSTRQKRAGYTELKEANKVLERASKTSLKLKYNKVNPLLPNLTQ